jgi:tuftelin-interacting protein 11
VYSSKEWDKLLLEHVIPKLGASLRDEFKIDPRKQDMIPLEEWVLPWHTLIRSSTLVKLLETNFFQKWLDILYIWLIQPNYKPDEVANWFVWWKSRFPQKVLDMEGISYGFNSGLELMNEAMRLGNDAPMKLRKPVFQPLAHRPGSSDTRKAAPLSKPAPQIDADITFRSLAEDYAVHHDLLFLPIGRSHTQTGKPLFKVTSNVDGRGGLTVYVGADAVFAQVEDGTFRAVSLDDMVKRAQS